MDALREEVVAGAGRHIQKGQEIVNGLRTWLAENPGASYHDRLVAQSLYDELVSIFAGRG
jgi:flagellin-specific chaperone FliS